MTEAKHTPGPWTAYEGWKDGGKVAMHPKWCEVTAGEHSDGSYISISGHFGLANARLIAAAPEMLAVLKDALEMAKLAETLTGCRGDDDFVAEFKAKVEAALSKAGLPQ